MGLSKFNPALAKKRGEGKAQHRVLYVEDDDVVWEVCHFGLKNDYQLTRARDAREVFSHLRKSTFDLILMDIQLQGSDFDGIEITKMLRDTFDGKRPSYALLRDPIKCPLIFVTAFKDRYSKSMLLAAGGDEVIYKPVDFMRLSLAITRLMVRDI